MGVIDSEFIVHQGIQTLGGGSPSAKKVIGFAFFFLVLWVATVSLLYVLLGCDVQILKPMHAFTKNDLFKHYADHQIAIEFIANAEKGEERI